MQEENRIRRVSLNLFLEDIADACDVVMEFALGKELLFMFDFNAVDCFELSGISALQSSYILSRVGLMKNLSIAYFSGMKENAEKVHEKVQAVASEVKENMKSNSNLLRPDQIFGLIILLYVIVDFTHD
jgi:hypothetical protein